MVAILSGKNVRAWGGGGGLTVEHILKVELQ